MNSSYLLTGAWTQVGSTGVYCNDFSSLDINAFGNYLYENGLPLWIASSSACSDGDCYADNSTCKVYYKPPTGHTPAEYKMELLSLAKTITIGGNATQSNSYFTIDGLKFTHEGIYIVAGGYSNFNLSGWTIQNCDFINTGISLWCNWQSHYYWIDTTVQNCTFDHCVGVVGGASMSFENTNNGPEGHLRLNVLNNTVTNNNTFPGRGSHNGTEWAPPLGEVIMTVWFFKT